ncbi:hypothetical protein HKBW3S06_00853 [Candidatus Hakubella thermalkaliphila]|uniref:OLD protein-like TOPRIM domain-containing protein n=1 Tax=Candidatus Hakubella thermalkaliphila TaxID=2754717 RepID=A0A6V8NT33_9ACTN|nr:ATP-dependent endonuclease [Candidatus Hakubella thermalkaliphila]GFP21626.1 hypothetical protein HKBW3S06_00853 [Candidatus Hakubella thermalkaliphila]GFP43015.1 hypothetical protein HKBW3C_02147 [Candidatus Hakubella thermalkaliphila]
MFFARKCLLSEGPAEKYGLPVLAQKLGRDFGDITILSCNGKSKIPYYQLLCKAFRIPFFTLFDLDGKNEDDRDNKRPLDWADNTARSVFKTSFEKLFGVGTDTEHKTSKLLEKIDNVNLKDIPKEISNVIDVISKWAKK